MHSTKIYNALIKAVDTAWGRPKDMVDRVGRKQRGDSAMEISKTIRKLVRDDMAKLKKMMKGAKANG